MRVRHFQQQEHLLKQREYGQHIVGIICIVSIVVAALASFLFFRVRSVQCQFEQSACGVAELEVVEKLRGNSMFWLTPPTLANYTVSISKALPDTILVTLEKKLPLLTICAQEDCSVSFVLASDGTLTTLEPTQELRAIDPIVESLQEGDVLPPDRLAVYSAITKDSSTRALEQVQRLVMQEEYIQAVFADFSVLLGKENLETQLHSLQEIRLETTIDLTNKEIDLRFSQPVIRPKS